MILVSQLNDNDHAINFRDGIWKVTKGAMMVAYGKKIKIMCITTIPNTIFTVSDASVASLWHHSLGHMSQKEMKEFMLKDKQFVNFDFCIGYAMGKQQKLSLLIEDRRLRSQKLELVHINV